MSRSTTPCDYLPRALEETCSFSFPFIAQPPEYQRDKRLVGTAPFTYFDRHVNEAQRLRQVVSLPKLPDDLIQNVDMRLELLNNTGEGLLPLRRDTRADFVALIKGMTLHQRKPIGEITTDFLRTRTRSGFAHYCIPLVSNWAIHPRAPKYYSALAFRIQEDSEIPPADVDSPCEDYKIRIAPPVDIHPHVFESIDDDVVKGALMDWHGRDLLAWIFLPLSLDSEQLLRDLDRLSGLKEGLVSPAFKTRGFPVKVSRPSSFDAQTTPWTLPVANLEAALSSTFPDIKTSGGCTIYPRPPSHNALQSEFERMKASTPEGLAHHVWRLAVQDDTTIIVINSGNYERIGIRHRASQTLYLSDMIDLTKPGYGKLHVGILLAAVDDILNRYRVFREKVPAKRVQKRRRSTKKGQMDGVRRSQRQKTNSLLESSRDRSPMTRGVSKILWNEIGQRPLLLLQFSGGGLSSSIPGCCLRSGGTLSSYTRDPVDHSSNRLREAYEASEYFLLTLSWGSSNGITGQVFKGNLQLTLPNRRTLLHNVVAKVAHFPAAQERVRHEYQVYQQLWRHGVKRIPEIYGLFEDIDNMATVLVMERAAYTFRDRDPLTPENGGLLQKVEPSERMSCIDIVKTIHDAGVVHRDLRAENLVIAQDGKPMVIDFDCALLDASDELKEKEIASFEDLLAGKRFSRLL